MRLITQRTRFLTTRRELVLLLSASMACVLLLTIAVTRNNEPFSDMISGLDVLLIIGVGLASVGALFLVWKTIIQARELRTKTDNTTTELRAELETHEVVVSAEPQVLMYWKNDTGLTVVAHTLTGIAGLPATENDVVDFRSWLDVSSSQILDERLAKLYKSGVSFNEILKTKSAAHIEVEGRAAAGRAIVRLRNIVGYRKDLANIIDKHTALGKDIAASQALLDALPMPVWQKSEEGKLTWVNGAYVSAVEAKDRADVVDNQIELLEQRQRKSLEYTLNLGHQFHERMAINVAGERKAHDVIALRLDHATVVAAIDVAELESAQGELDRQIEAFDRTLDKVTTAIAIYDAARTLVFYNEAFEKLWQLDTDWLDSTPSDSDVLDRLYELGHLPEVASYREWRKKIIDANGEGGSQEQDDYWHLPDGRVLHVISERRPDGGVTHLYVDETERLALESRFNSLTRVQGETLNSLSEGVAVFATDGRLQLSNTAFRSIWHLSKDLLDTNPHISELIHQAQYLHDDRDVWNIINQAITSFSDEREPVGGQMLRPDNSVIDYATLPLPDGATLLTFADVTDSKRYERALVERNEALVLADRLKNQFIGHVSYELRAPLTNIIGFSELLTAPHVGDLNVKQREYLRDIESSSRTLLAIIDDILDLATIDAGALELKLEPVPVRETINSAIQGVQDRAERENLILDIAIAEDAETFIGDRDRIRQMLYNLISNAVGFSHKNGVILITCWRDDDNGTVLFQVEDRGLGISKEDQERVFERFESKSKGSHHRGAGLGLSIVKNLVEFHGGEMILESQLGVGTRVTICLPERDDATIIDDNVGNTSTLDDNPEALMALDQVETEVDPGDTKKDKTTAA